MRTRALGVVGAGQRIVEEDEQAVADEALERALVGEDQRARARRDTRRSTAITSSGSALLGEGGEAAQVAEHHRHLAAVAAEQHLVLGRRRRRGRRPAAAGSAAAGRSARSRRPARRRAPSSVRVPRGELARLLLDRVVQRLLAQHRAHAREQRGVLEGLGQVVVAAGVEARDDVAGVGLRGHQDDRDDAQSSGRALSSRTTAMPSSFGIMTSSRIRSGSSSRGARERLPRRPRRSATS